MGLNIYMISRHPISHYLPINMGQVIFLDVKALQFQTSHANEIGTRNPSHFDIEQNLRLTRK